MSTPWNPAVRDPAEHLVGLVRQARSGEDAAAPTPALGAWLVRLVRLEVGGLEALLGPQAPAEETLTVVEIDPRWTEALVRGALRGEDPLTEADAARLARGAPTAGAARCLALLRSAHVARPRPPQLRAWADAGRARPLVAVAQGSLPPDRIWAAFDAVPAVVEAIEAGPRFAVDAAADPLDAPMRDAGRGVLDVQRIAARGPEALQRALLTAPDRHEVALSAATPRSEP